MQFLHRAPSLPLTHTHTLSLHGCVLGFPLSPCITLSHIHVLYLHVHVSVFSLIHIYNVHIHAYTHMPHDKHEHVSRSPLPSYQHTHICMYIIHKRVPITLIPTNVHTHVCYSELKHKCIPSPFFAHTHTHTHTHTFKYMYIHTHMVVTTIGVHETHGHATKRSLWCEYTHTPSHLCTYTVCTCTHTPVLSTHMHMHRHTQTIVTWH